MNVCGRYLSPAEKVQILQHFENEAGLGHIDLEIVYLLREINRIPGVVTTQSCAGHDDKLGSVSIRLSERMNELFERYVDVFFNPSSDFYAITAGVQQVWEPYRDAILADYIGRPRWVLWYEKEEARLFLTLLKTLLKRLSLIDELSELEGATVR